MNDVRGALSGAVFGNGCGRCSEDTVNEVPLASTCHDYLPLARCTRWSTVVGLNVLVQSCHCCAPPPMRVAGASSMSPRMICT